MFHKSDKKINIDMENVALPEIHIKGEAKERKDGDDPKESMEIDYSGAIPEYHPKKN